MSYMIEGSTEELKNYYFKYSIDEETWRAITENFYFL